MNKFIFCIAYIRNILYAIVRKIVGRRRFKRSKYNGKAIHGYDKASELIAASLKDKHPFLAARFGDTELRTVLYTLEIDMGFRKTFPQYIKTAMHRNAGFYPADDQHLLQFGRLLWDSSADVDLFGVWYNLMEDYVINQQNPEADLVELEGLEPYRSASPWSKELKGKRVLVVHPFEDSIQHQYAIKEKLFNDKNVLPDFTLLTYKAIQTNAGGECEYATWFDALEKMYNDIKQLEFDVAIVGCGAYGLPLAAKIKALNKQVIHLAGATQIMFGIRGARWDVRPEMQKYFNEFWIRPGSNERPKDAQSVEGACYW